MESLPDDSLAEVFVRLRARNNAALVCRKWYAVDRLMRRELLTGCGLNPPDLALTALCTRFTNLTTINISYSGWMSEMGKQVDDASLQILALECPMLSDISLNFCSFITDVGMANLTSSQHLKAVRLNFTPCISGRGLLSLVSGCYSLSLLHINRLMNVRVLEWLEFLGKNRCVESLAIRNCKGVGEDELARLGCRGWQNLREFFYEVDVVHRPTGDFFGHNGRGASLLRGWRFTEAQPECCPNLEVLSLTKCLSMSGTGLAWLLSQCSALRELHIDTCIGVQDEDLLLLAGNSHKLSSISLGVPFYVASASSLQKLTDAALVGISQHCDLLETIMLSFTDGAFPYFTTAGIESLVEGCRHLRVLRLEGAYPVTDSTIMVICRSESLEVLDLIKCHEITDEGLKVVAQSNLKELKVLRCFGLTDAWLAPLKVSNTLRFLRVEDCPQISSEGVAGAAHVVSYKACRL